MKQFIYNLFGKELVDKSRNKAEEDLRQRAQRGSSAEKFKAQRDLRISKQMPVKLLPSIRSFKITLTNFDWLFRLFGVERKLPPKLEFIPYGNRRANRFLVHEFLRLERARDSGKHDLY